MSFLRFWWRYTFMCPLLLCPKGVSNTNRQRQRQRVIACDTIRSDVCGGLDGRFNRLLPSSNMCPSVSPMLTASTSVSCLIIVLGTRPRVASSSGEMATFRLLFPRTTQRNFGPDACSVSSSSSSQQQVLLLAGHESLVVPVCITTQNCVRALVA